jgi:hypothetical protein
MFGAAWQSSRAGAPFSSDTPIAAMALKMLVDASN